MVMPNRVKIFPRGYSGGQAEREETHTTRTGDEEVTRLWEVYTSPDNQSETWAFRCQVLAAAKRLMSTPRGWFLEQQSNVHVKDYNYRFLVDTLRFVATGRRQINIYSWPDLIMNHPIGSPHDRLPDRWDITEVIRRLQIDTRIESVLRLWCSHPGGFDDLMWSLNLIFGDLSLKRTTTTTK